MTPQPASATGPDESAAYLEALEAEMGRFFDTQQELMATVSVETLPLLESVRALSTGGKLLGLPRGRWSGSDRVHHSGGCGN